MRKIFIFVIMSLMVNIFGLSYTALADEGIINVKDYGAAGNGVSDDTAAIKKALYYGKGKKVYFPEGIYSVSNTLTVKGNTEVYGASSVIKANSEGYTVFRAVGENINIHDLTIDGNQSFLRGLTVMDGSKNLTLYNVVLEHFGQPSTGSQTNTTPIAIRIEGGVENVIMDHLVIRDVYAKNVSSEVGWDHKVARGILISPAIDTQPGSNNITIQHSSITEIGPKDDGDGIVIQGFTNDVGLKIYNNVFDKNHKRAIKIQSPGAEIKNNQIINSFQSNNFYETYKETYEYDMWSAISVYADNVKIEGNTISGTGSFSAAVDIAGGNNVEVIGNSIANGENSVYTKSDTVRINKGYDGTSSFKNISIINNTLKNGRYGIFKVVTVDGLTTSGNSYTNLVYPTNIQ